MSEQGHSAPLFERDRATVITGAALLVIAVVAWIVVAYQSMGMANLADMPGMPGMADTSDMAEMPGMSDGPGHLLVGAGAYLAAWGVMMAAMMLPNAAPMISLYDAGRRRLAQSGTASIPTAVFAVVYLAVWLATGVPIYLASLGVDAIIRANPMVAGLVPYVVAGTLIGAGAFQFTALKRRCLTVCQHPMLFLMSRWQSGYQGTLRLAWDHAVYCVGCCWALMVVLVVAGTMSIPWMLLIAAAITAEKLLPGGEPWVRRGIGWALIALGLIVLVRPELGMVLRGPSM
jgi:predicted metal-binding membrane protein